MSTENATEPNQGETPRRPVRRRAPKPDALISESIDLARAALVEEFPGETIGDHVSVSADDERVMTHRFACTKVGYRDWQWYATLARAPRAKNVTVCELGLLPGDGALLAPEWVPWAQRVRPEDTQQMKDHSESVETDRGDDAVQPAAPSEQDAAEAELEETAPEETEPEEGGSGAAAERDLTAAEIEASVDVKRRARRRRYRTRSKA